MSEALELLLILGGVYLLECAQWVHPRAVGLRALLPGRWRWIEPWRASSGWKRGALLAMPWPPLSSVLICEQLPLLLGPDGVRCRQWTGETIPWDAVRSVSAQDHEVEVNDQPVARTATRQLAATLAEGLQQLARSKPRARTARLQRLVAARYDCRTVQQRLAALRGTTRWLRVSATTLFVGLFVGVPLLIWTPLVTFWLELALLTLAAWVATALLCRRALRRAPWLRRSLWPDGVHRVLAAASPLSAIRAADLLAREAVGDLDPLCVAAAVGRRADLVQRARHALVDLTDGESPAGEGVATDPAGWTRAAELGQVHKLLQAQGLSAEQLLAPPEPDHDACVSYCPRCLAQYTRTGSCTSRSCRGVELRPLC